MVLHLLVPGRPLEAARSHQISKNNQIVKNKHSWGEKLLLWGKGCFFKTPINQSKSRNKQKALNQQQIIPRLGAN